MTKDPFIYSIPKVYNTNTESWNSKPEHNKAGYMLHSRKYTIQSYCEDSVQSLARFHVS